MNGVRTRGLIVFEWLVILALIVAGVVFGVLGTAAAKIDPPSAPLDVEIGQSIAEGSPQATVDPRSRDATVMFNWTMMSSGYVEINAFVTSRAGTPDPPFTIVLYCGARLTDLEGAKKNDFDGKGVQGVIRTGDDAACRTGQEEGRARQILHVVGAARVSGFLEGNWNETKAGQRVARTPSVGFSGVEPDLIEVSAASKFITVLTAPATTLFENATPSQLYEGEVVYGSPLAMIDRDGNYEPAAVHWETEPKSEEELHTPTRVLGSGIARWTLLGGQALPQWSLLLSGVFFGIAAALLVEWPISSYRARRTAQAESIAGAETAEAERQRKASVRKPKTQPKNASVGVSVAKRAPRSTPGKGA